MNSTKATKIELGYKVCVEPIKEVKVNTLTVPIVSARKVELVHVANEVALSSGYRKINIYEQKKKEVYKKMNKMLGGI